MNAPDKQYAFIVVASYFGENINIEVFDAEDRSLAPAVIGRAVRNNLADAMQTAFKDVVLPNKEGDSEAEEQTGNASGSEG